MVEWKQYKMFRIRSNWNELQNFEAIKIQKLALESSREQLSRFQISCSVQSQVLSEIKIFFLGKHSLIDLGLESETSHMHAPYTIELGLNGQVLSEIWMNKVWW